MSDADKAKELIEVGSDIAGSLTGAAIGAIGGPIGIVAGAISGPIVTRGIKVAGDFAHRSLSKREKVRVGAGLAFAFTKINAYLDNDQKPREDGFFEVDKSGRSPSDEILEGALLKCKNEHEEKKTRHIGSIYANTAFMPDVSPVMANWLLQKVQELTYRQLCIMAIIKNADHKNPSWGPRDGDPAFEQEYKQLEYMFVHDTRGEAMRHYQETGEALPITGLSRTGELCYRVMSLDEIPTDDLKALVKHFPHAFRDK